VWSRTEFFVSSHNAPTPTPSINKQQTAHIERVTIYPIKSCGGVDIERAWPLTSAGLRFDRHFTLVDARGHYVSQQRCGRLTLVTPSLDIDRMLLTLTAPSMPPITITLHDNDDVDVDDDDNNDDDKNKNQDSIVVCGKTKKIYIELPTDKSIFYKCRRLSNGSRVCRQR
jgi:hypothetical protein